MPQVYDWEHTKTPPKSPTRDDIRFGIGYANDLEMDMTALMSDLLKKAGERSDLDYEQLSQKLESSTLGRQVRIIEQKYDGVELVYSKLNQIVAWRNYFIHTFKTHGKKQFGSDAEKLSQLINLLRKVIGQLTNATLKVEKEVKKTKNIKKNNVMNQVISAASRCTQYKKGRVDLARLAQAISDSIDWSKKFHLFLEENGIKTYRDEKSKVIRYVRLSDYQ